MTAGADESKWIFIGGAPRSGTTYLQLLLYATGRFATAQESHLFPDFLARMDERWRAFEEKAVAHRHVGLPAVISAPAFDDVLRGVALDVMQAIASPKPDAEWILEKTPANILVWPLIVRLFPQARLINVVRDPRAVVASTIAARKWAGDWAHREIASIAEQWVRSVTAGLALEEARPSTIRIRYERLCASTPGMLRALLLRLGINLTIREVKAMVESVSIQALREARFEAPWPLGDEPTDFFRSGVPDAWKKELSVATIAIIEDITQNEMEILGYSPVVKAME
jgi:hypothetical protein